MVAEYRHERSGSHLDNGDREHTFRFSGGASGSTHGVVTGIALIARWPTAWTASIPKSFVMALVCLEFV
jgi:hypothetical protein